MRVFPKGTRISSSNMKPVPYWAIGAQVCALNWQHFGTSNQLNAALFEGSEGYVLKPAALRAGGSGDLRTGRKKKLRLRIAGATDIPVPAGKGEEAKTMKPYVTCSLYHPDDLKNEPPKRKTEPYKHHKLGFLHSGGNPPSTDPIWDETLEWEYDDNELVFLRMLVKSDDSWAKNPIFALCAVRLSYVQPGWRFVRLLDTKGRESNCTLLVKFDIQDA
jgi:phosphatidylinositol phospholipase C delta